MGKVKQRFYANRDLREMDGRLTQVEEILQELLLEQSGPLHMIHTGANRWRVIQGNRIVFPPEGSAEKADCEAYMRGDFNASLEGGDVEEAAKEVVEPGPEPVTSPKPSSGLMPKKMGSREKDDGTIERYVEFTDDSEKILTEEEFLKAKDGGLEALMEIVNS